MTLMPDQTQSLLRTTKLLQAVMDGATDVIYLKDIEGRYLLFNRAACSFVNRRPQDVIGLTTADIWGETVARETRERELEVLTTGESRTTEESHVMDGRVRTFLNTRSPYRDEHGNIIGLVGISREITEMKRAEQELKQGYEALRQAAQELSKAKDEAQMAERLKANFLATMSHEIRTPMNAVIGMTRLALNTELTARQRNYLEKVDASARTLLNIINDVLDFSKIEAGGLRLENTEFLLDAVLTSVNDVTGLKAEEKGLEMILSVAPEVPQILRGDPLRLSQILINLVGNAVKFTHSGEINIRIQTLSSQDGRTTLQFSVEDTGIGLDPCQIDDLFRAFSQLRPDISRRYGGTGLGLAICRQLVELMGGRIWAGGELGHGSAFHFTVELRTVPGAEIEPNGNAPVSPTPRRVLIAEDNASARDALEAMVRGHGLEPTSADTGTATLAALRSAAHAHNPFDLLLLDWQLPDMEGLEVARRMLADPELRQIPTALMAASYGRDGLLRSAESLGLASVLVKPMTRTVLRNALAQTLQDRTMAATPSGSTPATQTGRGLRIPPDALQRLSGHSVLVVDDNALNREVVGDMLRAVGMRVDMALTGRDALRKLDLQCPDFVLMDMHMPEMDGLDATHEIRRQERFRKLPLIALTAQVMSGDREASLAAGMNAHLDKPIDEALLYETLMRLLPRADAATAAIQTVPTVPKSAAEAPAAKSLPAAPPRVYSLDKLGNDPAHLKSLLADFLDDTARTATQVEQHLAAGRLKDAADAVHSVRGSAFYLDAQAVFESATSLEQALRTPDEAVTPDRIAAFRAALDTLRVQLGDYVAEL